MEKRVSSAYKFNVGDIVHYKNNRDKLIGTIVKAYPMKGWDGKWRCWYDVEIPDGREWRGFVRMRFCEDALLSAHEVMAKRLCN